MLAFCLESSLTEEDFEAKLGDSNLLKKTLEFELDTARVPSVERLKELFDNSGLLKTYKASEVSKGVLYAGTRFEFKTAKKILIIVIDVKDTKKSNITVIGDKDLFIDSIIKNVLDVIKK